MEKTATGPVDTFNGPTGSSMIDYICIQSNMEGVLVSYNTSNNDPLNNSDHEVVSVTLNLTMLKSRYSSPVRPKIKLWNKITHDQIQVKYSTPVENMLLLYVEPIMLPDSAIDIDNVFSIIVNILTTCDKSIPTSRFRSNKKAYWNDKLTFLKKNKVEKFKIWNLAGRPRNNDNNTLLEHRKAKRLFNKELRRLSYAYENEQIVDAVSAAQIDRNAFWRIVKKSRKSAGNNINCIRNSKKQVTHDEKGILDAFREHFPSVCTPIPDPSYDEDNFDLVNNCVSRYNSFNNKDEFLSDPFTEYEVSKAIGRFHLKKACGYDNISTEHIKYAGPCLVYILVLVYNYVLQTEYIPVNFRRGLQVPLYKGKNTCTLDMNNYRGITLLTNFNNIFEILVWLRLEKWWNESGIISSLQGACRKGQSCVHSAYLLQETVLTALEENNNVFMAYFDVSKAFDTVWVNGLFYKMYDMGVKGKIWRLLYRSYIDFMCKGRIGDMTSEWYRMMCGIHQGGFLSFNYVAFINQLIVELRDWPML